MVDVGSLFGLHGLILEELFPGGSVRVVESLEGRLVLLLDLESGVLEYFFVLIVNIRFNFLQRLGVTQSQVHHSLIVPDQPHLSFESFVPMVLRPGENIIFFFERSSVGLGPPRIAFNLRIIPKAIVESSLLICRLVHVLETTRAIRDVCVSAASIVRVVNWLGVYAGQGLPRSLLVDNKGTY